MEGVDSCPSPILKLERDLRVRNATLFLSMVLEMRAMEWGAILLLVIPKSFGECFGTLVLQRKRYVRTSASIRQDGWLMSASRQSDLTIGHSSTKSYRARVMVKSPPPCVSERRAVEYATSSFSGTSA